MTEPDQLNHDKPWPFVPRRLPIPPIFQSLELDGPFTNCKLCEQPLFDVSCPYVVERIFRGSEPILEYAICLACQRGMCCELSEESLTRMQAFFAGLDHEARLADLHQHLDSDTVEPWIDRCLITGKRRETCRGYQLIGLFEGAEMLVATTPFMLADEAVQQLTKVLSKQTRDRMDDFTGEHFGMPPEFCEQPDYFPMLF